MINESLFTKRVTKTLNCGDNETAADSAVELLNNYEAVRVSATVDDNDNIIVSGAIQAAKVDCFAKVTVGQDWQP